MLRPPKYLRHKGRNLGYCRLDGRQHYFPGAWDSAESRTAYDAFLDAWLQKHDPKRSVATIGQLCLEYVRYADATYRKHGEPTGEVNNIRSALKLLLRTHRHATVREISLPMLVKWRDSLIGRPDSRFKKRGRTISRQYINRCTKIVLRMLRWARQKGMIEAYQLADVNQIDFLKANRSQAPEASKSKLATDEQVEAAVEHLPPHIAAMVELQRLTGMRPGEVIVLRPCDVTIRTDGVMAYRPHIHKLEHHEGVDRVVMIGPRGQEILRPWLNRAPDAFCFQPREVVQWRNEQKRASRKTPVQPSQRDRSKPGATRKAGKRFTTNTYAQAIRRACDEAKVPRWTPNQLRKIAATIVRQTVDLDTAAALLGHADPRTTAKHYATQLDLERAARAVKQIG